MNKVNDPPDFLGEVINAIDDPVIVKDEQHRWVLLNDKACEMVGHPRENLIGKRTHDFFPKKVAEAFEQGDDKVLKSGKTKIAVEEIEWGGRQRTIAVKKSLFRDSVTDKKFIAGVIRDITKQVEMVEKLRKSEKKYRLLADNVKDVICVFDIASRKFTYFSPSVKEMWGYTPAEAMRQPLSKILTPDSFRLALQSLKQAVVHDRERKLKIPTIRTLELQHIHKNGSIFWAEVTSTFVRDENGNLKKAIGVTRDISERKRAEEELRNYQKMVESAHDVIFFKDLEGRYIVANAKTLEAFGLPREKVIGRNDLEIMPDKKEAFKNLSDDQKVFRTGKATETVKHMTGSGGQEYWFQAIKVPQFNKKGKVIGLIGIARDISEQRKIENKLRESEVKFHNLFENSIDAIFIADTETGILIDANKEAEKLLGKKRDKIIGMHQSELHPLGKAEAYRKHFQKHIRAGRAVGLDAEVVRKDGSIVFTQISASVIDLGGKKVIQGIFRDVTEDKKMGEKIRESETKFRELSENSIDAVFIANAETGIILEVNKEAERLLGRKRQEIIGMHQSQLHPPELKSGSEKGFRGHIKNPHVKNMDVEVVHKNGSKIPVEISASVMKANGKKVLQGIFRDVTDQRKSKNELKNSEILYRNMFENTGTATGIYNEDRVIEMVNDKFVDLVGYPREEIEGKMKWSDFPVQEDLKKMLEYHVERRKRGGKAPMEYECRIINKNKEIIHVLLKVAMIPGTKKSIASMIDITDRKNTEEALQESEERYKWVTEYTQDGVAVYEAQKNGKDFIFLEFNRAAEKIENFKRERVIGKSVSKVFPGIKKFGLFKILQRVWKTGNPEYFPIGLYRDNHVTGWRENFVYKLPSGEVVAVYSDETEKKKAEESLRLHQEKLEELVQQRTAKLEAANLKLKTTEAKLQKLVEIDGLTGVSNHRHLKKCLDEEFKKAQKTGNYLACVMVDLDNFKEINDKYGHQVGDKVLQIVAEILQHETRQKDLVARYGGEEFLLLLPDKPSHHVGLKKILERIRKKITARIIHFGDYEIKIAASFGATLLPNPKIKSAEHFIHLADKAMYAAKAAGKNCCRISE